MLQSLLREDSQGADPGDLAMFYLIHVSYLQSTGQKTSLLR